MCKNMHYDPIIKNNLFAERHSEKHIWALKTMKCASFGY